MSEIPNQCTLKILRYDAKKKEDPYYQDFVIELEPAMTVLSALFKVQDHQDGTLAFRYSCRGAVCGSCAMLINGNINLACRVQMLSLNLALPIVIEPLPNMEVIQDLIVDMTPFWEAFKHIKPYLITDKPIPEKEFLVSEKDREAIDQYVNCILCASCYGACPILARNEIYLGPAALAWLYRFARDPRDTRTRKEIKELIGQFGPWSCQTVFECIRECPKDVRPADGISGVKSVLITGVRKKK